jgi:hypothetical protein
LGNSKQAAEFKAKYEECQGEMARLLAGDGGGVEGEIVKTTAALAGLTTKDNDDDDKE